MTTPTVDNKTQCVDEIDYSKIVISDDAPVDGLIQHHEMFLLTEPLHASWRDDEGVAPKFVAYSDVGVFYNPDSPPIVPDVLVSLGVSPPQKIEGKKDLSYFIWRYGKAPDVVVEVVSNKKGNELESKRDKYAEIGVSYYIVFDPFQYLSETKVHVFTRYGNGFVRISERILEGVGLGITLWHGTYQGLEFEWLRWTDANGNLILTGPEARALEAERADSEAKRANAETERSAKLAAKLRELGVDPDAI